MAELDNIIVLSDENGNEVNFEFLDLIEYEGAGYVVLLPCEEDDKEVVILKVEEEGEEGEEGEEAYLSVEDDATLGAVFAIFKERFKDYFDFSD